MVEQLALHEEFEPIAVDNGTKGVQTAKAGQIDLVIMDVGLPDIDPVARVWRALTDHHEFGTWFGVRLEGPFVPGLSRQHVAWKDTAGHATSSSGVP